MKLEPSFVVLTLVFTCYLLSIYKNNELRSPVMILVLFTGIIFYLPIVYYAVGFDVYMSSFSWRSLVLFTWVSVGAVLIQWLVYLLVSGYRRNIFSLEIQRVVRLRNRHSFFVLLYLALTVGVIIGYLFIFRDKLPLYALLFADGLIERPDKVGGVPLFYTFSSFYMVLVPAAYLYLYPRMNSTVIKVAGILFVATVLVAGGHKGLVAFFCIFLWFFAFRAKVSLPIVGMFLLLLFVYGLTKGKKTIDQEVMGTITESALRRFAVTQGLGFIVRLDMMNKGELDLDGDQLKVQVFQKVYRLERGTCPTIFVANIIPYAGYFVAAVVYALYCFLMLLLLKSLAFHGENDMFLLWNIFIIAFLTGMTDFSFYMFLRCALAVLNIFIVAFLQRLRFKPSEVLN